MADTAHSATVRASSTKVAAPAPFFELSETYEHLATDQARIKAGKSARNKALKSDGVK